MSYNPLHSLNGSETLQDHAEFSSINPTVIMYKNGLDYLLPSYSEPQFGGGSQGAIEEVLPSTESHSRSDAEPPENARTE